MGQLLLLVNGVGHLLELAWNVSESKRGVKFVEYLLPRLLLRRHEDQAFRANMVLSIMVKICAGHAAVRASCHSWPSTLSATMSVSLVSNAYLDETSVKIRAKPVPWEASWVKL
jgi:hypothetical protein